MKRFYRYIFSMFLMAFALVLIWNTHTAYAANQEEDTIVNEYLLIPLISAV